MRLLHTLSLALVSASIVLGNVMPLARDLPPLPASVTSDLLARDPGSFETAKLSTDTALAKRTPPNNLYGVRSQCTGDSCFG